jgi:hypothetical protein
MPTHGETPVNPVKIKHIEIQGAGASAAKAAAKSSGM